MVCRDIMKLLGRPPDSEYHVHLMSAHNLSLHRAGWKKPWAMGTGCGSRESVRSADHTQHKSGTSVRSQKLASFFSGLILCLLYACVPQVSSSIALQLFTYILIFIYSLCILWCEVQLPRAGFLLPSCGPQEPNLGCQAWQWVLHLIIVLFF